MFQGRLVNLSCSSVPSFVVSITSTTQVQKEITRSAYASLVSASEERGENKPERQCGMTLCKDIYWHYVRIPSGAMRIDDDDDLYNADIVCSQKQALLQECSLKQN